MSKGLATYRQSDVARCVRAAKAAGAAAVEVRPNGAILIIIEPPPGYLAAQSKTSGEVVDEDDIVL